MNDKKWRSDPYRGRLSHKMNRHKWQIQVLLLVVVGIIALSFLNAIQMSDTTENNAKAYSDEITTMIAKAVEHDLEHHLQLLENIADSISQNGIDDLSAEHQKELLDFLERKAEINETKELHLLDEKGQCQMHVDRREKSVDGQMIMHSHSVQLALDGVASVEVIDRHICYVVPILHTDGDFSALAAVFDQTKIQQSIDRHSFKGKTLSCIVDSEGKPVILPTDTSTFLYIDEVYHRGELDGILEVLNNGTSNSMYFDDANGNTNLLASDPLGINDWRLLSIVPVDLMMGSSELYISNSFYILIAFATMFLLLLYTVFHFNRESMLQLRKLAYVDELTGGMNSEAFQLKYRSELQEKGNHSHSVVMLNIRNFKLVNERLGFGAGDRILKGVYRCILNCLHEEWQEFVCRGETDHFFICLDEQEKEAIQQRVDEILAEISGYLERDGLEYPLPILSGCCIDHDKTLDIQLLQERARAAERSNFKEYGKCLFWDDEIIAKKKREEELLISFDSALKNGEFEVHFQPKVSVQTELPMGAEALIRWNHGEYGRISPGEFVPIFEKSGKICELEYFVFREICRFYKRRKEEGKTWYPVSMNLSRYHFHQKDFLNRFIEKAEEFAVEKDALEFELTESMLIDENQVPNIQKVIHQMHDHGFRCSIDDFGSGYSSLGMLKDFDVDCIKMDRTFFLDLAKEKTGNIIKSVIDLAKTLKMQVVAEGIERESSVKFLKETDCTAIQGYYFSKPLSIREFEAWIEKQEEKK